MSAPALPDLPDAEAALAALAARMRDAVAYDAAFVGIYSGGAWLAERLGAMVPGNHAVGYIDVSYYRDDYSTSGLKGGAKRTELAFDVDGATIVLVDDVLYTGRSVRAAINELFDYGRPQRIELAVLVDRGGRELPVEATYTGARLAVAQDLSIVLSRDATGLLQLATEGADGLEAVAERTHFDQLEEEPRVLLLDDYVIAVPGVDVSQGLWHKVSVALAGILGTGCVLAIALGFGRLLRPAVAVNEAGHGG